MDKSWKGLYFTGAASALAMILIFRRFFAAEMDLANGFGIFTMPESPFVTAGDWFVYLQQQPLAGLILLGLVDLINYGLLGWIGPGCHPRFRPHFDLSGIS